MEKIILFYAYTPIASPEELKKAQRALCLELQLTGRILIAAEGINGTLAGPAQALESYVQYMRSQEIFQHIDFKESLSIGKPFPKLRVLVKPEIVRFGIDPQRVTADQGGVHLSPQEAHELIAQKPDLVLLDARNQYESAIGTFTGAIRPPIQTFRELPTYITAHKEQFQNKEVLMFCTGGVRCERASAYLKQATGARTVYQISGGIHRYVEQYPDGYFRGKNYVFDGRIAMGVTSDVQGQCASCGQAYDTYTNCLNTTCNKHIILCPACIERSHTCCSPQCTELVSTGAVTTRRLPSRTAWSPHDAPSPSC